MKDPFLEMYGLMRDAPPTQQNFHIGVVKSKLPNLVISLDGIDLESDDFLINSNLVTLNNVNIEVTNESVNHNLKDELNVNDKVLLVNADSTFIILSKVILL